MAGKREEREAKNKEKKRAETNLSLPRGKPNARAEYDRALDQRRGYG